MRKAVYVTAVLVIGFLIQPLAEVAVVEANPLSGLSIGIKSPENRVYNTTTISIIFNVDTPLPDTKIVKMSYSLDGSSNRTLSIYISKTTTFGIPKIAYVGTGVLRNLGNGTHTLDVYAFDAKGKIWTYPTGRTFMVNATSISPTVSNEQLLAASIVIVAVGVVALGMVVAIVIYKKRIRK